MSQRGLVLRLLRERGAEGVSAHEFTYRFGITRAAAIIHELRNEKPPFDITTVDEGATEDGRQKMARYVLKGDPERGMYRQSETGPGQPGHGYPGPFAPERSPLGPGAEPEELLVAAVDLPFPCGCVRSADGRGWLKRCDNHAQASPKLKVHW